MSKRLAGFGVSLTEPIVHIPRPEMPELWRILRSKPAHCEQKKWYQVKDWLRENGPRWGKWDIAIHGWDHETRYQAEEYEFLFELYQLNWFEARTAEKVLRATDRPIVVTREYSWH